MNLLGRHDTNISSPRVSDVPDVVSESVPDVLLSPVVEVVFVVVVVVVVLVEEVVMLELSPESPESLVDEPPGPDPPLHPPLAYTVRFIAANAPIIKTERSNRICFFVFILSYNHTFKRFANF